MVYKIMQSKQKVFLESFLAAAIIFILAFSIGLYVESSRIDKIAKNYKKYEINSFDLKLQNYYFQTMVGSSCDEAVKQNFKFADEIYDVGLQLEQYEEANQITDDLLLEKQRYALLKTELWLNTLLLKNKCGYPFDTVVYFYYGDPKSNKDVSEQKIISNALKDLKEKHGNKLILLPIAGDFNLEVINLQMSSYNVTHLPAILINEKTVLYGFNSVNDIEKNLYNITRQSQ